MLCRDYHHLSLSYGGTLIQQSAKGLGKLVRYTEGSRRAREQWPRLAMFFEREEISPSVNLVSS